MNKSELIKTLADQESIGIDEAGLIVDLFFGCIRNALLNGDRVEIRGFGSFKIKEYPGYLGRNPRTGEVVRVDSKRLPFFRIGKELKDFVNS